VSGGSDGLDDLENSLDETLRFAIQKKPKLSPDEIISFDEVRQEIIAVLQALRARAEFNRMPLIYHLDVSPVYPNCKKLLLTLGQVDEPDRTIRAGQDKPAKTGQDEQERARRAGLGETSRTGRDEQDWARRAGLGETSRTGP
jgi:hypothetical protein